MLLRPYRPADCPAMARLFYDTVHTVCAADYSPGELAAWATGQVDLEGWNRSFLEHHTLVAEEDGLLVGFGDMDATGYLDRLYVHRGHQGRGIAKALVAGLEEGGRARGVTTFTTHASITARPFFERQGYRVLRENRVVRAGVVLQNFVMEKRG